MKHTHENNVEKFYSLSTDIRGLQEEGYLSFGYWTDEITEYSQAVKTLINRILKYEKPLNSGTVLNVACGYGSETVEIYKKIHPEKIIAIDITDSHIQFAKHQISSLNLSDKIDFEKMDACKLNFPAESFDYVIGIEGPAHFNTREIFLRKAYEMLKPKGVLLLSDIIVDNIVAGKNLYNRIIAKFCAKHWYMPKANWMSIKEMNNLLNKIGFDIDFSESAGKYVYPGFSQYNLKMKSIKNAIRTRGIRIGLALSFISWLLGYVHRRKMIDYVILRAIKKAA
ncbi:MAG: class I SAM-dependent methyltransferase [Bacteroidales bacterium]|nr:class I SAM-dependent methyltransferase [Bacteroidales bacterium]MBN2756395.1 class I SAM-dependent methyltransferase [Bacteroidales bacterium]